MSNLLSDLHKEIRIGDICKIDMTNVNLLDKKSDKDNLKFLGFRKCPYAKKMTSDCCGSCYGYMVFENLRTRVVVTEAGGCYGYELGTPLVIVGKTIELPEELFDI